MGSWRAKAPNYGPLAEAQKYAADLQYKASMKAIQSYERERQIAREETAPWRQAGLSALQELQENISSGYYTELVNEYPEWQGFTVKDLQADPGYEYEMAEASRAVRRQAGSVGMVGSGGMYEELQKRAQGLAATRFDKARNRAIQDYQLGVNAWQARQYARERQFGQLSQMAGYGQAGVSQYLGSSFRATAAGEQARMAGAQARGAGAVGAANAMVQQQIANNQARQQTFDNILGVASIGLGFMTPGMPR